MYTAFDNALTRAFSNEHTPFGAGHCGLAIAVARQAASDNRIKALNEASLGEFKFAKIHEWASIRFHEDAEAMQKHAQPIHHSMAYYLGIAARAKPDDTSRHPHLTLVERGAA